jgi:transposase
MEGEVLRDDQWERLREFVPGGRKGKRGPRSDGRLFLNALLWLARSGGRWRDLPERFGPYQTAKRRYYRWVEQGVIDRIFEAVSDDPDIEWLAIDSTVIRAQAQASGARIKKGALKPGSRALARRARHKSPRRSRCARLADPLRPWPWPTERHGACLRANPRHPSRPGARRPRL